MGSKVALRSLRGNLCQLNADDPQSVEFRANVGPLGVIKSSADAEVTAAALDFMERVLELGNYADDIVEHDSRVGQLLDKIDDLDVTDNALVMDFTDNGAETFT